MGTSWRYLVLGSVLSLLLAAACGEGGGLVWAAEAAQAVGAKGGLMQCADIAVTLGLAITGSIIMGAANQKPVQTVADLRQALAAQKPGEPILLQIHRKDASLFVAVTARG